MVNSFKVFWKKLSMLGVDNETDFQLYKRVILSNYFAIAFIVFASIFALIYTLRQGALPIPLMILCGIGFLILIFNYFGINTASRMVLGIAPGICLLWLNIYTKMNYPERMEAYHYTTVRLLIGASMMIPLTVFMPKEKVKMYASAAFLAALGFSVDVVCDYFGVGSKQLGIVSNYRQTANDDLLALLILLLLSYVFLTRLNGEFQKNNRKLLEEAENKNEKLNERENELKQTIEEVEKARKEETRRNWTTTGLTDLNTLLRQNEDPEKMYHALLKGVVKYLNVNQGGLYISEEKDGETIIKLKSCYAYNRQKYVNQEILPGEGLIGQCYLEGEKIYLKEIPAEYVQITSGLGEATPKNILIIPLKMRDKVEGIIEIASFKELKEHEIAFLESAGEDIASTIGSAKTNLKTKELLDQSRRMSNELMEKEHIMRQNMEELRATQEATARKEQDYLDRIAKLEAKLSESK